MMKASQEQQEAPAELVAPGTPGAVQCKAPGCENWFVKRSGRHVYCKAAGCTYRRGAPPQQEVAEAEGAAAELLLRLQDPDGGEVGPELLGPRLRAFSDAQRSGDASSVYGAAVDTAVVFVRIADRAREGLIARPSREVRERTPTGQPVGLVHAVIASHVRTAALAEQRVEAVWTLMRAREELAGAQAGVAQTAGTEQSVQAEAILGERRAAFDRAERALQSVEAAWTERRHSLEELRGAAASVGAPMTNGGATNGRSRVAG